MGPKRAAPPWVGTVESNLDPAYDAWKAGDFLEIELVSDLINREVIL